MKWPIGHKEDYHELFTFVSYIHLYSILKCENTHNCAENTGSDPEHEQQNLIHQVRGKKNVFGLNKRLQ